ncbi:MAG TPA: hypothetical protein VJ689_07235 [Gaiellaceae bacterium]|nr:hypothetical protein [Gaiellaceae bacterium]
MLDRFHAWMDAQPLVVRWTILAAAWFAVQILLAGDAVGWAIGGAILFATVVLGATVMVERSQNRNA